MGSYPAVSHTLLALSAQWTNSPSRKWRRGVSPRLHLVVLCLVWIKRIIRQGTFKILLCNRIGEKLLRVLRVVFRIPSNISDGTLLQKQPTDLIRWLLPQKSPTTDFWQDSKCESDRRCCECGVLVDCRCMEFVVAGCVQESGWGSIKLQETRNPTFGDLGSPNWKRTGSCISWTCFEEKGAPLDHWANGGYVDVLFTCGECSFCSLGSWSYSKAWVKLRTKSMWHCSREVEMSTGWHSAYTWYKM